MKISRRKFMLGLGASCLGLSLGYTGLVGPKGIAGNLKFAKNTLTKEERLPQPLADSHYHIKRHSTQQEFLKILGRFFEKIEAQSISMNSDHIHQGKDLYTYEDFISDLESAIRGTRYSVLFKDPYASRVSDGRKEVIFIRSQEVFTVSPKDPEHIIHLCIEGLSTYLPNFITTEEAVLKAEKENATIILNHPFSKPVNGIKWWLPNDHDIEYLIELYQRPSMIIEVFNSFNTLWMSASNEYAESLASQLKKTAMIADSDAHGSTLESTLAQIGTAGTYLPGDFDAKSLTGREIIQLKKSYFMKSPKLFKNYIDVGTFMSIARHWL